MEGGVFFYFDKYNQEFKSGSSELPKYRYEAALVDSTDSKKVIKGYILEDTLEFSISNEFENNVSLLGDIMNKVEDARKGIGSYHVVGKKLQEMITTARQTAEGGTATMLGGFSKAMESADDLYNSAVGVANQVLGTKLDGGWYNNDYDSADAYMYAFKGTSISHPNKMKITFLSDSLNRDILKDVNGILDLLVGDYETTGGVGQLFGVQKAPNGYEMSLNTLTADKGGESAIKGTWTLYIGNGQDAPRFPGLVVTDIQISQSNTYALHGANGEEVRPLYIEMDLTLKSVIKYTKHTLKDNILKYNKTS